MPRLADMTAWLDDLLQVSTFSDYCPNGLQVQGAPEVSRVVTGVSASLALFEAALENNAELILVHHGIFWQNDWPFRVQGAMRKRLAFLLANELSLLSYHLPLDAHPEVGNNATAAAGLSLGSLEPFGDHKGRSIGFSGVLTRAQTPDAFRKSVADLYGKDPLVFLGNKETIEKVGIISGGAGHDFSKAIEAGLDAFVTGEPGQALSAR